MQNTRPNKSSLADALAWLELTYSNLKINTFVIFALIGVLIALMSIGAYQQAAQQATFFLGVPPTITETNVLNQVLRFVSDYGLAGVIAICYFSNATQGSKRRELTVDALSIALAIIVPQVVFHAGWLWTVQSLITTRVPVVAAAGVAVINQEWLTTVAFSAGLLFILAQGWRVLRRSDKADAKLNTKKS